VPAGTRFPTPARHDSPLEGTPAAVRSGTTDTDRFVATVSPVIQDPLVQSALAGRITSEVLSYVDVQQIANEAVEALAAQGMRTQLVDRLRDLTGPLADGVANLVHARVDQIVASPQFAAAWNRALQVAHEQATTVLSGESAAIGIENGRVVLDLGPFIDAAKQQLVDSGFTAAAKIPQVHPTIDLFAASTLVRAQTKVARGCLVPSRRSQPRSAPAGGTTPAS
jgi:hypothetical protein